MIETYLDRIGFDPRERKMYLTLAELGVQPASVIARKCGLDRVTTYKHLKKLADRGFVKISYDHAIQRFGVESFEVLQGYLREQKENTEELLEQFPVVFNALKSLQKSDELIPKLRIFEGGQGIRSCFRDFLSEAKTQNVKQIRMLTSNTFSERLGETPLSKFISQLFDDIRKNKIDMEVYEATGTLIPERLVRVPFERVNPEKLPAARGATNIFLVGDTVYVTCYKQSQIGLKIKHREISQIFHFLFDVMGKK